ncbi:MAG: hypothetical protein MN733_17590 [Nitrososphaera sp.]|nr:hypothetical protein [Nitrososphaera sp.]
MYQDPDGNPGDRSRWKPLGNQTELALLTLLVSFLTAIVTALTIDDVALAKTTAYSLFFLCLLVGAYFIFWPRIREARFLIHLNDRWNGIDLKRTNKCNRIILIVGGILYRSFFRLFFHPIFWVSLPGLGIGWIVLELIQAINLVESMPDPFKTLFSGRVGEIIIMGVPWVITIGTFGFSQKIIEKTRERDPHRRTIREFVTCFDKYREQMGCNNVAEMRRQIAEHDPGPVLIISVAATDLLKVSRGPKGDDRYDLFAKAWDLDPQKQFKLLLADPTAQATFERNKRLNGKFLEYYAVPYLRLMFKSYEDKKAGLNRISFRRWNDLPDYRVVMSRDRLIMQRYGYFSHGFEDTPVILHRVHLSSALENRILSIKCWESLNNECAFENSELWDKVSMSLRMENHSVFKQFADNFERLFATCCEEEFIVDWPLDRLRTLSRYCGLTKKQIRQAGSLSQKLAQVICRYLELETELLRVVERRIEPTV